MAPLRSRLLGLCLVPMLFCGLDATLTLVGQSPGYWAGDHSLVNEASPTFHDLLRLGPGYFLSGIVVWATIFVCLIVLAPDAAALVISIAVTFGHTVGAATWLLYRFEFGYQLCNALFLMSAVALGLGIHYGWQARPAEIYQPPIRQPVVRWLLIAALFAAGVYLFVWPRSA